MLFFFYRGLRVLADKPDLCPDALKCPREESTPSYLLSGWTDRKLVPDENLFWWIGKLVLPGCVLLLLALQVPVLRNEARLIRNMKE
jgi:hypothetical protein